MFWVYRYKGFSFTAARTVHTALVLAGQQGCSQADTGHLLLALVQTAQGTAADFLRRKRVTSTALAEHTAAHAAGRPRRLHSRDLAPELSKAMEFAVLGAHAASAARAENEHLLCAILEDSSCTASRWLAALGIELPQAARECRQLSGQLVLPAQPRMAASRTGRPSDKYGRDLTRLAQEGRLDPVLCRDAELDRMIEILCRRQKNNPCLLGEPGVGKSALAEALAQRIAAGQITPALRGKRVLALDMASMVAGTKYRGDFEERFKNLLEELYRDRSTILFIDEIHIIAGAGAAEGAIDAASILKPMLARGEIQLIGATTPEEYRKTIQKDSALERRFGRVMVEEPTPAAAETILAGLMPRYERYHGVSIPPEAIHAAVELSVRYLPGRLRNSTESSFQKRRTKDSAVFAFRKVQRSIFPIFFLLFLISYLQSSSASASISFTFSSFTADITFTLFSVQVIFLLFSNMPLITLPAIEAQDPFSIRPIVLF